MGISGSVVLVTGANRGIGAEFVRQLLERGAAKVYAAARDPHAVKPAGRVEPIQLDVTNHAEVEAAARQASDVQIVINNAGIAVPQPIIGGDISVIRNEFETNFFGTLDVASAFAPALKANGGGTILNALSAVAWLSFPGFASYSASKAAAWSLTDGLRHELKEQGTHVVGLLMGPVDTTMGAQFPLPDKATPAHIVTAALDGIESGTDEVLGDDLTKTIQGTLTSGAARYAALFG
ncbi:SDR family oxidoreductase [Streptomyces mirabilis]|uniref:SDR family oxidoreductase n=1 Tax=Streptomyces mirabilis TaxID=68239 RepID=UPI00379AD65E